MCVRRQDGFVGRLFPFDGVELSLLGFENCVRWHIEERTRWPT